MRIGVSPRSSEFLQAARRRLAAAEVALEQDPSTALSAAYYAMLYGARAALSERDTSAKTHRGTWHEFRGAFVESGRIDADLAAEVLTDRACEVRVPEGIPRHRPLPAAHLPARKRG